MWMIANRVQTLLLWRMPAVRGSIRSWVGFEAGTPPSRRMPTVWGIANQMQTVLLRRMPAVRGSIWSWVGFGGGTSTVAAYAHSVGKHQPGVNFAVVAYARGMGNIWSLFLGHPLLRAAFCEYCELLLHHVTLLTDSIQLFHSSLYCFIIGECFSVFGSCSHLYRTLYVVSSGSSQHHTQVRVNLAIFAPVQSGTAGLATLLCLSALSLFVSSVFRIFMYLHCYVTLFMYPMWAMPTWAKLLSKYNANPNPKGL
jgi:hypothetical protein